MIIREAKVRSAMVKSHSKIELKNIDFEFCCFSGNPGVKRVFESEVTSPVGGEGQRRRQRVSMNQKAFKMLIAPRLVIAVTALKAACASITGRRASHSLGGCLRQCKLNTD